MQASRKGCCLPAQLPDEYSEKVELELVADAEVENFLVALVCEVGELNVGLEHYLLGRQEVEPEIDEGIFGVECAVRLVIVSAVASEDSDVAASVPKR